MARTITTSYDANPETAANLARQITIARFSSIPVIIWSVAVFLLIVGMAVGDGALENLFSLLGAIAGPLLALGFVALILYTRLRRQLTLLGRELEYYLYEFGPERLVIRTAKTENQLAYSLILRAKLTGNGYIFTLTGNQILFLPAAAVTPDIQAFVVKHITYSKPRRFPNPLLAGFLNLIIFGSGYLYLGRRRVLATALLLLWSLLIWWFIYYGTISSGDWRTDLGYLLLALGLASDAYLEGHQLERARLTD